MGAEFPITFPVAVSSQDRHSLRNAADISLKLAVRFWSGMVVLGQLFFAFAVASFFGMAALRGHSPQAWTAHITHGYVPGDTIGNFAVATHLFSAVVVILAGLLQLVPQIRQRAPIFHRWNGRLYIATAFSISLAGLYMTWIRGSVGDLPQHLGSTLMALLIMVCAVMALRYAMVRDIKTHRRWALRLYLVISASLFIRAGIFLSLILNRGPFGFDPATFSGPFLTFISFAQYLVPLAILEIYFGIQQRPGIASRFAMAASLFVFTLALGAGTFAVAMAGWVPEIKKAYDGRTSIAETLSATIASSGIDRGIQQYRDLKSSASAATYNFDEGELNTLGYEFLHAKKFAEAVRILQLNVDAYPKSANAYDSLAEAYMDAGQKAQAIANYQKSLQLNPKNMNAVGMLKKLNTP